MAYRIAAFVLGLVIAAYWARVIRMARKARRKTGRAANLLPPEPVGRALRIIWAPLVIVWVVHPFVTALSHPHWGAMRPLIATPWLACPAVLVAAACLWLSRKCWKIMGKNWRMGIDPSERTSLVITGPYAYVRHPIYALSQAMMIATAAAIPSPLMLCAAALHLLLLHWEARREEAHLSRVHGPAYKAYCGRVRRFLPAPRAAPNQDCGAAAEPGITGP